MKISDVFTRDLVERRLDRSLARLIEHDIWLMKTKSAERAVSHRLAVYLEQEFPGWFVDCEYNRQDETNPKRIRPKGYEKKGKNASPDIIVHVRGPKNPNLLAIEMKPDYGDETEKRFDLEKLERYGIDHRYSYTVYIEYGTGNAAGKLWCKWIKSEEPAGESPKILR